MANETSMKLPRLTGSFFHRTGALFIQQRGGAARFVSTKSPPVQSPKFDDIFVGVGIKLAAGIVAVILRKPTILMERRALHVNVYVIVLTGSKHN